MAEDPFKQTKAYIEHHPDTIKNMGYIISHDPGTGLAAAHSIFVAGEEIWIIDEMLVSSHFKRTYLVENALDEARGVLGITKHPVGRRTPELEVADRLMQLSICGVAEILNVYNLNTGQKAILYRYYNGGDLHRKIEAGTLSSEDRKVIADSIIRGVAELHRHGIFHRDVKPANILLQIDIAGHVKEAVLSDFGEGTLLDNPLSIQNIEHHHSAPEGNALMEKHKRPLEDWYQLEKEKKRHEDSEEFKQKELAINKAVGPLIEDLKNTTSRPSYDSWSLGLTLWCLFTNHTNQDFPWIKDAEVSNYGAIESKKKHFIEVEPWKQLPEPYRGITKGLLEANPEKRLTAEAASTLLE